MNASRRSAWILGLVPASIASAQVTQRVSVDSAGSQGNGDSGVYGLSISADGRYVAFASDATDLVPGDTNGRKDVFVRDRQLGTTECVSVDSAGVQGDGNSGLNSPTISADGRYVVFTSFSTNLVPGDTNGIRDVFVRDRLNGTTERVSIDSAGTQGDGDSGLNSLSMSSDGRYVAFGSFATNLVPGDTNASKDIFVRDRQSGTTVRVSLDSGGAQGNDDSGVYGLSISADGRYVAFESWATNFVAGDTNAIGDVFVRDLQSGTIERVSVDSAGAQGNSYSFDVSISADGRCVAFRSNATNLVPGDTNSYTPDIFVRDRQAGTTELVSVSSGGAHGNGDSFYPSISADGRYVAFASFATTLVPGDTNGGSDIFVRDRQSGTTDRVSVDSAWVQGDSDSGYFGLWVSADGRFVAFASDATNLTPEDSNGSKDVFVRDRLGGPDFTSLCDPGVAGVIGCPCSNPPSGPGRGCDNSSSTGGAILSASGGTYLSSDSLVFETSGERATAFSIVLQGNLPASSGVVHGQGVWCAAGAFKRLYRKSASGGSITAPEFGAGDSSVSSTSAAKGDVIQPGQSRFYVVYYRDPVVLGGCPVSSTFNSTQTGEVSWAP